MKLTFLGAVGTVTGSKYLLESNGQRLLLDCGLFQGLKELRMRNWGELPFNAAALDAVVLTHAHLDHSGYLPRLMLAGFKGPIYCSPATFDLCKILLPDSGRLQEEDADSANRHSYSKHTPALPLYTEDDAKAVLNQFRVVEFGVPQFLGDELNFTLHHAGHILGAAMVMLRDATTSLLFSGDLGRLNDPVMCAPAIMQAADYLVLESTYGNRLHDATDPGLLLADCIRRTVARGGTVIIPAFAVGRAQALLYYIHRLKGEGQLPADLPIYLDSPMAINASELLVRHPADHRLPHKLCNSVCAGVTYVRTTEESKALMNSAIDMPKVVISASGMLTGGRVLHHLKHFMPNPRNMVLLAGYQAEGTRGARLLKGESELKIHGAMWPVKAEIAFIPGLSAHADYAEILEWLAHFTSLPKRIFLTHGEAAAATSLRDRIVNAMGADVHIPAYGEQVEF